MVTSILSYDQTVIILFYKWFPRQLGPVHAALYFSSHKSSNIQALYILRIQVTLQFH